MGEGGWGDARVATGVVGKSSSLPTPRYFPATNMIQIVSCQEPGGKVINTAAEKDCISHDSTDGKCPEKANLWRQKVGGCLPGLGRVGRDGKGA